MKKIYYCLTCIILFTSCTHRIVRTGYDKDNSYTGSCDIVVKRFMNDFDFLEKVGEIKLGESGVTTNCNEALALEILKKEGCSLNADIINIIEEKRPDAWSSCYRCRAEFYKYTNPEMIVESDEVYKPGYVTQRVAHDKRNNTSMIVTSVVVGIILGLLAF